MRELKIAVASSRKAKTWNNRVTTWETFVGRLSTTQKTIETITDKNGRPVGVEIACCGDAGLDAIMKALDFCRDALNDQRCDVDD